MQASTLVLKRRFRRARKRSERGYTLIEILVVITIIGLLMSLVGPRVLNYLTESKVKAARIQIQSFASALDLFYLDAGRYPTSAEGLAVLVARPGAAVAGCRGARFRSYCLGTPAPPSGRPPAPSPRVPPPVAADRGRTNNPGDAHP